MLNNFLSVSPPQTGSLEKNEFKSDFKLDHLQKDSFKNTERNEKSFSKVLKETKQKDDLPKESAKSAQVESKISGGTKKKISTKLQDDDEKENRLQEQPKSESKFVLSETSTASKHMASLDDKNQNENENEVTDNDKNLSQIENKFNLNQVSNNNTVLQPKQSYQSLPQGLYLNSTEKNLLSDLNQMDLEPAQDKDSIAVSQELMLGDQNHLDDQKTLNQLQLQQTQFPPVVQNINVNQEQSSLKKQSSFLIEDQKNNLMSLNQDKSEFQNSNLTIDENEQKSLSIHSETVKNDFEFKTNLKDKIQFNQQLESKLDSEIKKLNPFQQKVLKMLNENNLQKTSLPLNQVAIENYQTNKTTDSQFGENQNEEIQGVDSQNDFESNILNGYELHTVEKKNDSNDSNDLAFNKQFSNEHSDSSSSGQNLNLFAMNLKNSSQENKNSSDQFEKKVEVSEEKQNNDVISNKDLTAIDSQTSVNQHSAISHHIARLNSEITGESAFSNKMKLSQENFEKLQMQSQILIKDGGGEVSVKMTPEGMGEVHLKVMLDQGQVKLEINSKDKNVKKLIEESLVDLKSSLAIQQIKVDHIKVNDVSQTDGQNKFQQNFQQSSQQQHQSQQNSLFDASAQQQQSRREQNASRQNELQKNMQPNGVNSALNARTTTSSNVAKRNPYVDNKRGSSLNMVA